MTPSHADIDKARNAMVDDLVQRRIIHTAPVERAFRRVARHAFLIPPYAVSLDARDTEFVETDDRCRVYADVAVRLQSGKTPHCGAPAVVARQIEQLAVADGMRLLHVGTGSGYCTALLAELAGERGTVVGVEHDDALAELIAGFLGQAGYTTVTVRQGDGWLGVPEAAPFDRILVSAGVSDIAPAWIAQLGDEGQLVLPLCQIGALGPRLSGGVVLTIFKAGTDLFGSFSTAAFFVPLRTRAASHEEGSAVADGLKWWFALEEFLRTDLPIRVVMKSAPEPVPDADSVPWLLETRHAVMWVEPN